MHIIWRALIYHFKFNSAIAFHEYVILDIKNNLDENLNAAKKNKAQCFSSAPLNPFFLSVTTYSSTFFLRWDFKSESETEGATKTNQKPTVPKFSHNAMVKCLV